MGIAKSLRKANYLEGLSQGISKIVGQIKENEKKERQRQYLTQLAELYNNYQQKQEEAMNQPNVALISGQKINAFSPQILGTQSQAERLSGSNTAPMDMNTILSNLSSKPELQNRIQEEMYITNQLNPAPPEQKTRQVTPLDKYLEAKKISNEFMTNLAPFILNDEVDENLISKMNVLGNLLQNRAETIKPRERKYEQYDPEKDIAYTDDSGNLVIVRQGEKEKKMFHRTVTLNIDGKPTVVGVNDNTGDKVILGEDYNPRTSSGSGSGSGSSGGNSSEKDTKLSFEIAQLINSAINIPQTQLNERGEEVLVDDNDIRATAENAIRQIRYRVITDGNLLTKIDSLEKKYGRILSPQEIQKEFKLSPPQDITDPQERLQWLKDNTKDLTDKQLKQLNEYLGYYNEGVYQQLPPQFKRTKNPTSNKDNLNNLNFYDAREQTINKYKKKNSLQ